MSITYYRNWLRYNAYELTEHENGLYISVADLGDYEIYNPFEIGIKMLLEFFHIGHLAKKGEVNVAEVLSFVETYGMLGFQQSIIEKEYDDGSVKVYKDNFVTYKPALTMEDYFKSFLPTLKSPRHAFAHSKGLTVTVMMEHRYGTVNAPSMLKHRYSENVKWIADFAQHLYRLLEQTQRGEESAYQLGNVRPAMVSENGIVQMEYACDSLKSMIDVLFVTELLKPRRVLKLCKHCGGAFVNENPKVEYCGASCRNVHNVKLSRRRARST